MQVLSIIITFGIGFLIGYEYHNWKSTIFSKLKNIEKKADSDVKNIEKKVVDDIKTSKNKVDSAVVDSTKKL